MSELLQEANILTKKICSIFASSLLILPDLLSILYHTAIQNYDFSPRKTCGVFTLGIMINLSNDLWENV